MIDLPWGGDDPSDGGGAAGVPEEPDDETPVVTCEFQDGILRVYDDRVVVDRGDASSFDSKTVPVAEILDVTYAGRFVIGYLQIDQDGVPRDGASRLSTPVDENTLHFGRGKRDCAKRARDAILERIAAE